ncbi:MAG: cytochrome P450 [Thermoleophilaceae bacterium]|nr:cytochrome P450 [Thermoleophilaceae bacterium]
MRTPPQPTQAPAPVTSNPVARVLADLADARRAGAYPPGPTSFSLRRTHRLSHDPLPLLLGWYEQYGPIFTVRVVHAQQVFMLGPAANHYVTVSHAENFGWREGAFKDLVPLLGDALLTTDGPYHDRARRIMMPAFHRERIEGMLDTMVEETQRALAGWHPGMVVDVYGWARRLAMRIALRTLLGLDPAESKRGGEAAHQFERALSFYGRDFTLWLLRGPGSPWQKMQTARGRLDAIVLDEIRRRRGQNGGPGRDVLSMLVAARDEDGSRLSDGEIRDQVTTLLFAGHDTSTSAITFLMHELACNPTALSRLRDEQERVLGGEPPTVAQLGAELPELEMAIDETLRLYPPAWIGPRRALEAFEFEGQEVPAGAYVAYCSWASHRLPDVWEDPGDFKPERFTRENSARRPKGAYVPFGGGSRICIGKRLGQTVVKVVSTLLLQRFAPELPPGYELSVRQMPTLSPRGGLPVILAAARR